MFSFLPAPLLGMTSIIYISVNTVVWSVLLYVAVLLKLLSPMKSLRHFFAQVATLCAKLWVDCNNFLFNKIHDMHWDITGLEKLDKKKSYLLMSNHRSWT
ncbi:acyltransferase, partial [candidate division KSB1 bacterium]|nr:acyltransferase [candidate division KSB1 bacterium]